MKNSNIQLTDLGYNVLSEIITLSLVRESGLGFNREKKVAY